MPWVKYHVPRYLVCGEPSHHPPRRKRRGLRMAHTNPVVMEMIELLSKLSTWEQTIDKLSICVNHQGRVKFLGEGCRSSSNHGSFNFAACGIVVRDGFYHVLVQPAKKEIQPDQIMRAQRLKLLSLVFSRELSRLIVEFIDAWSAKPYLQWHKLEDPAFAVLFQKIFAFTVPKHSTLEEEVEKDS